MKLNMTQGMRDPHAPTPPSGDSLTWSDARLLGFKAMDDSHEAFYQTVQHLLFCDGATAMQALDAFETHAREHFGQEEEWMHSTGFPPRECHVQEHAAVLDSLQGVKTSVAQGQADIELVHEFAVFLFQWFPGHADYLDAALAAWMSKCTYGGKPVVLRRRLPVG
ncbi:bacteriohemerythrin [Azohydromonas lata]|uniref:Hemerythrin domain-containing protein n=1 Tax=Azohydromonas lata TaxID=45677 RepID=A0ABU5IMG7_9BURK|nr:hemerythrin domain-containing protein [Azohydromonas lata]MDZ5460097.1 hemerythrin domain-containing protein [Azohydromonas lata]